MHFGVGLRDRGAVLALRERLVGDGVEPVEEWDEVDYVRVKCRDPYGHIVEAPARIQSPAARLRGPHPRGSARAPVHRHSAVATLPRQPITDPTRAPHLHQSERPADAQRALATDDLEAR